MNPVFVYIDLDGRAIQVGRMWIHVRGRRESATFEYSGSWLASPACFALEPALSVEERSHNTREGLPVFGAIGDSAPDRWGRALIRRATLRADREKGATPRTLREIDFLLGVNDEARTGALRFSLTEGGPFLALGTGASIPPMVELPKLLAASDSLLREEESGEELRLLLAPGSSLGGAQPKASVRKDSQLFIAKFPSSADSYNRIVWESVALDLAERSGITVPERWLQQIDGRQVLILKRFDRKESLRIPFLSGMSMISARDNETHSYLELADRIKAHGAFPDRDLHELLKRIVFTVLISNVDDHMRNHGFLLHNRSGWVLSPAYDLNPTPLDIAPRILTSAIDIDDQTASIDLTLDVAEYFNVGVADAKGFIRSIANVVSGWRDVAFNYGLSPSEIERMSSAFEHEDMHRATRI